MCAAKLGSEAVRTQESEGEDAADSRVTLAQDMTKGNMASRQSRIKLQEVRARVLCPIS